MRHFGHGVGHLQYGQQHEVEPNTMMTLEDLSDSSDKNDTEDMVSDDTEIVGHDSDDFAVKSEEESCNGEIVNDDEGEWSGDADDDSDIISDSGGSDTSSDSYASY